MKRKRNAILKAITLAVCLIMLVTFTPQTISAVTAASYGNGFEQIILEENEKPGEEPEYALPEPDYPEIIADKAADHAARLYYKEEMNTLVYMNDDGTETLYMFGMDVKYTDESGEIKDKSTKLALSEEGYYNPDNDIRVNFAKDLENGVSVMYNDIVISVRPAELKESVKQAELQRIALPEEDERERVVYADAFEKADIVYTPTFDGFKEDIVVNEYNGVSEYVFTAFAENARIEGHDIFRGEERIGDIGAVYVLDSEGECTYGVLEAEEIEPGEYILTVSVDAEFLENAAYPVYIDPSVTIYSYDTGLKFIEDAPVYSNSNSAKGGSKYNLCGYVNSNYGYGRVLIKYPGLIYNSVYNHIMANQINSVKVYLREGTGNSISATVTAYPFQETWSESTVKYSNVNINNYNTSSTYAVSKTYTSSPKWWVYNVTETVKAWKNGSFNGGTYGMIFINSNESSSTYYRNFLSTEYTNSSYYPYITMDYTPRIIVTPSTQYMGVGETYQLTANTYPSGVSYTWFSMDNPIATVSNTGLVTAVSQGTTYIIANGNNNVYGTCIVTVIDLYYLAFDYDSSLDIAIGEYHDLAIDVLPLKRTYSIEIDPDSDPCLTLSGNRITGTNIGSALLNLLDEDDNIVDTLVVNVYAGNSDWTVNRVSSQEVTLNNHNTLNDLISQFQVRTRYNGQNVGINQHVIYSVIENDNDINYTLNDETGLFQLVPSLYNNNQPQSYIAHKTGELKIRARCKYNFSAYVDFTVIIECDEMDVYPTEAEVLANGRYIIIPHSDQSGFYHQSDFMTMLSSKGLSINNGSYEEIKATQNGNTVEEFRFNQGWIENIDRQLNSTRYRKLLQLIACSKYCTLWSHGNGNGISCNSQDSSVILTKDMIKSVHDGFFNYTELLFLAPCSTGYTSGTWDDSIMQLFVDKGVNAVVGFENAPRSDNCSNIEQLFYVGLSVANASIEDVYEYIMQNVGNNVTEGFIIRLSDAIE